MSPWGKSFFWALLLIATVISLAALIVSPAKADPPKTQKEICVTPADMKTFMNKASIAYSYEEERLVTLIKGLIKLGLLEDKPFRAVRVEMWEAPQYKNYLQVVYTLSGGRTCALGLVPVEMKQWDNVNKAIFGINV